VLSSLGLGVQMLHCTRIATLLNWTKEIWDYCIWSHDLQCELLHCRHCNLKDHTQFCSIYVYVCLWLEWGRVREREFVFCETMGLDDIIDRRQSYLYVEREFSRTLIEHFRVSKKNVNKHWDWRRIWYSTQKSSERSARCAFDLII